MAGATATLIPVIPRRWDGLFKQLLCIIRSHRADNFASKYQDVGNMRLTIAPFGVLHCGSANMFVIWTSPGLC
jgi:hypothetical protein